jgi:hypothetical protein
MRDLLRRLEEAKSPWEKLKQADLRALKRGALSRTELGRYDQVLLAGYRQGRVTILMHKPLDRAGPASPEFWSVVSDRRNDAPEVRMRVGKDRASAEAAALRLMGEIDDLQIDKVDVSVERVDEWATLHVEVRGEWPAAGRAAQQEMGQRIIKALLRSPQWAQAVQRVKGRTLEVGYVGDTEGDGQGTREVAVPIPRSVDDFEVDEVGPGYARFSMAER